jgi:hypothetical protein
MPSGVEGYALIGDYEIAEREVTDVHCHRTPGRPYRWHPYFHPAEIIKLYRGDLLNPHRSFGLDTSLTPAPSADATLINRADPKQREELREYALGLLRDQTETSPVDESTPLEGRTRAPLNTLGLAVLLILIGGVLLFLVPPVGLLLLFTAVLLGVWGGLRVLFTRGG